MDERTKAAHDIFGHEIAAAKWALLAGTITLDDFKERMTQAAADYNRRILEVMRYG